LTSRIRVIRERSRLRPPWGQGEGDPAFQLNRFTIGDAFHSPAEPHAILYQSHTVESRMGQGTLAALSVGRWAAVGALGNPPGRKELRRRRFGVEFWIHPTSTPCMGATALCLCGHVRFRKTRHLRGVDVAFEGGPRAEGHDGAPAGEEGDRVGKWRAGAQPHGTCNI